MNSICVWVGIREGVANNICISLNWLFMADNYWQCLSFHILELRVSCHSHGIRENNSYLYEDLSAYTIYLRIKIRNLTNSEEGSEIGDTEVTYNITWWWNQEKNPDLSKIAQCFLSKLHICCFPIDVSQVTGTRCLKM